MTVVDLPARGFTPPLIPPLRGGRPGLRFMEVITATEKRTNSPRPQHAARRHRAQTGRGRVRRAVLRVPSSSRFALHDAGAPRSRDDTEEVAVGFRGRASLKPGRPDWRAPRHLALAAQAQILLGGCGIRPPFSAHDLEPRLGRLAERAFIRAGGRSRRRRRARCARAADATGARPESARHARSP